MFNSIKFFFYKLVYKKSDLICIDDIFIKKILNKINLNSIEVANLKKLKDEYFINEGQLLNRLNVNINNLTSKKIVKIIIEIQYNDSGRPGSQNYPLF